jgi:serine protease Do
MRQQFRLPQDVQGVIITDLDADSPAAQAGLEQGDIIVQVNHKKVNSVQQFNNAVNQGDGSGSTLLLVRRGEGSEFVVVPNKK